MTEQVLEVLSVRDFGFARGSTSHLLVCNQCHTELFLPNKNGIPYKVKCPTCRKEAKTDTRLILLLTENSSVHRFVVIAKPSRNYIIPTMEKEATNITDNLLSEFSGERKKGNSNLLNKLYIVKSFSVPKEFFPDLVRRTKLEERSEGG